MARKIGILRDQKLKVNPKELNKIVNVICVFRELPKLR